MTQLKVIEAAIKLQNACRAKAARTQVAQKREELIVTAEELLAAIESRDMDKNELIEEFRARLKTREARLKFKAVVTANCSVRDIDGKQVLTRKVRVQQPEA